MPLASWRRCRSRFDRSPIGNRGELDDPDQDGLSNILEFAIASDPLAWTACPSSGISNRDGSAPTFRFHKNQAATDALLSVEYSTDLREWKSLSLHDPEVRRPGPLPVDERSPVLYEASPPEPDSRRTFFRLRATRLHP